MGQRQLRVNELVLRQLSESLHKKFRQESVTITLLEADVSPDLKNAQVYYSVIGNRTDVAAAARLLAKARNFLRFELGRKVILKYTPELNFVYDPSPDRSQRLMQIFDEIQKEEDGKH